MAPLKYLLSNNMFLSDQDILKEIEAGKISLEPFSEDQLQPATYDIRLGNTFIINDAHSTKAIDPVKGLFPTPKQSRFRMAVNSYFIPG